ncbi:MAG: RtcB family protein [Candidatus Pacearchaeota archaeon]|nr:RtcB family protein [Candidatus Pacearchaeota archaeon]
MAVKKQHPKKQQQKQIANFAPDADEETLRQFKACYSEPYVLKAALMPDAHVGYVAPIGSVLAAKDYIVPAWVGYDIGCGMTAVKLPKNALVSLRKNSEEIYREVKKGIPMGLGEIHKNERKITTETQKEFQNILVKFKKGPYNRQVLEFLQSGKALRNLGTLGSGNHFIEMDFDDSGLPWIVIHSGSRGVGHKFATFYMKKSSGKTLGFEATYPFLSSSPEGKEYLNLLDFCLEFAKLNRLEIAKQIILAVEKVLRKKIKYAIWTNKNHNHAIKESGLFVHRKGATPAKKGERGIIPANMRDGSFLVVGKGNKDFISSSSHGAGRKLSRAEAKRRINPDLFKKEMQEAKVTGNFSQNLIDEAPEAYKNIYKVLELQKSSIKVISHLKPFINWKGDEKRRR